MNSSKDNRQTRRKLVAKIGELAHGMSKKFIVRSNGREVEAMLVNYQGEFFAYFNRCPHIGITLGKASVASGSNAGPHIA
jgi:nitrite reductase/ring-hydroxylating ferredoxin subunit